MIIISFFVLYRQNLNHSLTPKNNPLDNGMQPWEDGYRTAGEQESFEWWYFDGILDDGETFVISWNIDKRKGKQFPNVTVSYNRPDGENYYYMYLPPPDATDDFQASPNKPEIKLGNNTLSGDLNTYHLRLVDMGDISELDFVLSKTAPSWVLPDNPRRIGKSNKYSGWLPSVPNGIIKGKMIYKGEEKAISGSGYHDHNWYNFTRQDFNKIIKTRYWGRAFFNGYSVIFDELVLQKNINRPMVGTLYVSRGDKILYESYLNPNDIDFEKTEPEKDPHSPLTVYKNFSTHYQGSGKEITVRVAAERDITPIQLTGSIENILQQAVYRRYLGPAFLEINIDGKKENLEGKVIWEYADNPEK